MVTSYPVGSIVKLDQAPHNDIQRLKGVKAYAAVVPSISGKRWDSRLANSLYSMCASIVLSGCLALENESLIYKT